MGMVLLEAEDDEIIRCVPFPGRLTLSRVKTSAHGDRVGGRGKSLPGKMFVDRRPVKPE